MARLRLLILFCLATAELLTTAAGDHDCDEGWTKYGSRCFKFLNHRTNWAEAERSCESLGAELPSIHSAEENSFIANLILKVTGNRPHTWIGGSDAAQEGNWQWVDGSPWDFASWSHGQPDGGHGENYVRMNGNFWNDGSNTIIHPYVCAKGVQTTPEPTPVFLTLEGVEYQCVPKTK